jgi:hypothetical protein
MIELKMAYIRRVRYEARVLVSVLAEAMGQRDTPRPPATAAMRPGRMYAGSDGRQYRAVSPEAMMAMSGIGFR